MSADASIFVVLICGLVLALVIVGFWFWMLIECLTKEPTNGNEKLIWALVLILLQPIGAAIYFLVRRPQRIQRYGA